MPINVLLFLLIYLAVIPTVAALYPEI